MATAYNETGRTVSIGRILSRTFAAIGSNPGVMLTIAFLFGALPATLIGYYQQTTIGALQTGTVSMRDYYTVVLLGLVANMILRMIVQGGLVRATMTAAEGGRATLGECLSTGLRRAMPVLGVALLSGIAIGLGFLLFIVPGIILYMMWSVAVPVAVVERQGVTGALSRSGDLTKGARWTIFALMLIIWVVILGAGLVTSAVLVSIYGFEGLARAVQSGLPLAFMIVSVLISTATTVFTAAIPTALYIELREWKDGPLGETLADIFA